MKDNLEAKRQFKVLALKKLHCMVALRSEEGASFQRFLGRIF
jgi:hypothetical protein